jgi:subtilisin family serine protease
MRVLQAVGMTAAVVAMSLVVPHATPGSAAFPEAAGISPTSATGTPASPRDGSDPVADGVRETLEADGQADVIVSFAAGSRPSRGQRPDLDRLRGDVAVARQEVLGGAMAASAHPSAFPPGFRIRKQFDFVPALAVTVTDESALEAFARQRSVISISLDIGAVGALAESVEVIAADARQARGNTGEGVTVAVMDTGADLDHPDLVDSLLPAQACFGARGSDTSVGFCPDGTPRQFGVGAAEDDAGHGTHVTGIISSAGTISAPGVAPGAKIVPIKVLDDCSFAGCAYFFSEIISAWDWIIANNDTLGIDVINMSLSTTAGFAGTCDGVIPAATQAIGTLRSLGVTPFAASGNFSDAFMGLPACLSGVVSVGATDNDDAVGGFTSSNASTDIFAPGVGITSLAIGGGTRSESGTSMAAPHAAGCAALLIEAGDATTPDAITTRLKTSSVQVTDRSGLTFPRIDCSPTPDSQPPTITSPNEGKTYVLNQQVEAEFTCEDELFGTGVDTCVGPELLDTSAVGPAAFEVSTSDNAGNTDKLVVSYHVVYDFSGVLSPINADGSSTFRVGQVVPVRFALADADGTRVPEPADATLSLARYTNDEPGVEFDAVDARRSNAGNAFAWDADDQQYIFNLSTRILTPGVYRLTIALDDDERYSVVITLR